MAQTDYDRAIEKLQRYAYARNRDVDRETRTFSLTDDEAVALLERIGKAVPESD